MSSPSQKHGSCGHIMASFNSHSFCARCREKSKGSDPCISHDCPACNSLTEEQRLQLFTPSYRLKKEKRELKKSSDTPNKDSASSSLIDPSSVTVVGAVDAQGVVKSPRLSSDKKKKKPNPLEKKTSSKHTKSGEEKSSKSPPQSHRSSADTRTDELDLKWSERFKRLEALLIAKTLDRQEPTFAPVKVTPTHTPPVGVVRSSEPFIRPTDKLPASDLSNTDHSPQRQAADKSHTSTTKKSTSSSSDLHGNTHIGPTGQSTSKLPKDKPPTDQHSDLPDTGSPILQVSSKSSSAPAGRHDSASMDTDSNSEFPTNSQWTYLWKRGSCPTRTQT